MRSSSSEARGSGATVSTASTSPSLPARSSCPPRSGWRERVARRLDRALDAELGYYPLAVRLNRRHGFHRERMAPGHANWMLDSERGGHLPSSSRIERAMERWHFGTHRHVPRALLERMRADCSALVLSNVQPHGAVPFLLAARRLGLPIAAHVASWDHTVGKGVIASFCDEYVVQNEAMRDDLARYHDIGPERVVVTGWPQTDIYARRRSREEYDALLRSYGLDPARPLVVVMGNTPTNAPYEGRFVERVVEWWESRDEPASRCSSARIRATASGASASRRAIDVEGAHVQEASFTDFDVLATILQHTDCVVTNAGTILLEALVNDRPAVCVLYDEDAPAGESWAVKNVIGEHYRELAASSAFYRADRFEDVVEGIERALAKPGELHEERRRVAREVVGDVDGRASDRVVDAIVAVTGSVPRPA